MAEKKYSRSQARQIIGYERRLIGAWHEAGHCLKGLELGIRVRGMELDRYGEGHCVFPDQEDWDALPKDVRADVMLAGPMAERSIVDRLGLDAGPPNGFTRPPGWTGDYTYVQTELGLHSDALAERERDLLAWADRRTKALRSLARPLMRHGKLDEAKILKVFAAAKG